MGGTPAGQSFGILDPVSLFAPRKAGVGPQGLPVNRTARAAGVLESATDPGWTLTVANGSAERQLDLAALAAKNGEPRQLSGKQELYENIINRYVGML